MHPIYQHLQNPLTTTRNSLDRQALLKLFPLLSRSGNIHFLALRRYIHRMPEKFFNRNAYTYFLPWLLDCDTNNKYELQEQLRLAEADISRALLFLREINSASWHDDIASSGDDYDLIKFIDTHIHPNYLRLIEAVLVPLTRIIAYFSRISRGKGTEKLDAYDVVNELKTGTASRLVSSYRHTVRNAIAHGGITFLQGQVRYQDKKGNKDVIDTKYVIQLFDDLLDTCNGLAAAIKVFFIASHTSGYKIPRELFIEELQEETSWTWWKIEGCAESEIAAKRQLVIYARPDTRDHLKVFWHALQSAILAEYFAPGYDRYFLSLRSSKALPGFAAFDGKKLQELREAQDKDFANYSKTLEDNLYLYIPKFSPPKALNTLEIRWESFKNNYNLISHQFRQRLGIPEIQCRHVTAHRNRWGAVINGKVIIESLNDLLFFEAIEKYKWLIIKSAIKQSRKEKALCETKYLPLGYAYISIYRKDYRQRRLDGFGLGEDLVCTIQYQKLRNIKAPDILGSIVNTKGSWRIAWNKAWINDISKKISEQNHQPPTL